MRASKSGTPLKRCYFAVIGCFNVKTVVDRFIYQVAQKTS